MPTLFDPVEMGALTLPNRILMAPLTRGRATREAVPTPIMADYYAQRAGAGLIISEATGISREGLGWPFAPGLWTGAQVEGWKPVTRAVHEAGGQIVAQLRSHALEFLQGQLVTLRIKAEREQWTAAETAEAIEHAQAFILANYRAALPRIEEAADRALVLR